MYNEFEKEDDSWRPPQKKWWVITKKVLGYTVIALALAFIAFLIVRMIISKPPKGITELVWTDKAFEAYTSAKESGSKLAVLQISSSDSFDKGDGDEDKSDDIISEAELYGYICDIYDEFTDSGLHKVEDLRVIIDKVTKEKYAEPFEGAKTRLDKALEIILVAYFASNAAAFANILFNAL